MKAADFEYVRAPSLDAVIALLRQHGDDARVLAGGQSLLPGLNMRLSEPRVLVDIGGLAELRGIRVDGGVLRIGALTRHAVIEESELILAHAPLMSLAAPFIGHKAIRNRGTLGGSLANADPAAEWPSCMLALDATLVLRGPAGERRVPATEFFLDLYTTALAVDEILVACEIPLAARPGRFAFDELSRRRGDYAIVGLAAAAWLEQGRVREARLAFLGTGNVPLRARQAEAALAGRALDEAAIAAAGAALAGELDPLPDLYHTAETKSHLAGVLLARMLRRLASQP